MLDREFEQIEVLKDASAHCLAFIAIHNTRLGPAFGGIRRWPYRDDGEALRDALELAGAMTWKCALAGVPGGGGKAVIVQHPDLDRAAAYRLIGRAVEILGGRYYTGPDVGTEVGDLDEVARHTQFVAAPGPDGPGNLAEPTALGVFAGIEATLQRLGRSGCDGATVAVQGLGEVGWRLAELLHGAGASLTVADLNTARTDRARDELGLEVVDSQAILAQPCDVLAPCALGGIVNDDTLPQLRARAIAGAANNVLAAPQHGRALFERGIVFAPDFAINAGALIQGAIFHLEGAVPDVARIRAIGDRIGEILDRAAAERRPPEQIAATMARARVAAAPDHTFIPTCRTKP